MPLRSSSTSSTRTRLPWRCKTATASLLAVSLEHTLTKSRFVELSRIDERCLVQRLCVKDPSTFPSRAFHMASHAFSYYTDSAKTANAVDWKAGWGGRHCDCVDCLKIGADLVHYSSLASLF
jgi:hypothetical protein